MTRGLALTGRVITAAAAIMVTVFASFLLGEERMIKLFGLGLASAVLIDAVIIRSILVPAIMQLLRQIRLVDAGVAVEDPAEPGRRARPTPRPTARNRPSPPRASESQSHRVCTNSSQRG